MEKKCIGMELSIQNLNFLFNNIVSSEYLKNNFEFRINCSTLFLKEIAFFFNFSSLFKLNSLTDLFGIDYKNYLQVNYYFLSIDFFLRVLLKNKKNNNMTFSVENIFFSANWLEREVWDLYGIFFKDSIDLRRILTDYGFDGFPLLKKFPLSGYLEFVYLNELKKVVPKKIELSQQHRIFDFNNAWIVNSIK